MKTKSPLPFNSATETPTSTLVPVAHILSDVQLSDWRGSITTFNGFTGTKPVEELDNLPWTEICKKVCPDKPIIVIDKSQAQYFVPCLLKEAPLVGNTLEAAIKKGESTVGKMRSKSHVTAASILVVDIDRILESGFVNSLNKIKKDGIAFIVYTTHSNGDPAKPGMRVRLNIPLDRPLNIEEYAAAWHGFDQFYWQSEAGKADASGANLYQQAGHLVLLSISC